MGVAKLGAEIAVEASPDDQGTSPSVAGNPDGTFTIAWEGPDRPYDPDGDSPNLYNDVYARLYAANGPTTADILVNTEQSDPQFSPDLTARPDGSFVVAYDSGVEDQLPGTFLAHQRLAADGAKLGDEVFPNDYTYYNYNPDGASFSDGSYVLVAMEENNARAYIYSPAGLQQAEVNFGFTNNNRDGTASVTTLDQDHAFVVWTGYDVDPSQFDDPTTEGIFGQTLSRAGILGSLIRLVDFQDSQLGLQVSNPTDIDPIVKALPNGNVVVAFAAVSDTTGRSDIYVDTYNASDDERRLVVNLTADLTGGQHSPDVAVLADGRYVVAWEDDNASSYGDGSGSAIVAQLFNADGSYDAGPFLVNTATAGSQVAPSVAAIGSDFVVTWQGPNGIEAQRFDADARTLPDTYLLDRAGTHDGSPLGDQYLPSNAGPTTFYFDVTASSGHDTIVLDNNDIVATNRPLHADPDSAIRETSPEFFDLDGSGPGTDGFRVEYADTLRFLGTRVAAGGQTIYAYANYLGFPSLVEGTIGKDALTGTAGKDNFLFDTALGVGLGTDQIKNFGAGDRIVTTTQLSDPNHDGKINLDSSDRLIFNTPAADGASWLKIFNDHDKAVSHLIYDTSYTDGAGEAYYVYKAAGDIVAGHGDFTLT